VAKYEKFMQKVDDIDRRLLRLLQEDAELSTAELAERAGVSAGVCWRRIERMEREGIILGRRVEIEWKALGYEVHVFLRVTLEKVAPNAIDAFLRAAREVPEICDIQTLLGRVDIRMGVRARDLAHYQEIYRTRILGLPHISEIEALMLVSELKNTERLAI
jgi:Lrp/AsnC family transcriptional regulator